MGTLSEMTLKAHFEELKKQFSHKGTERKEQRLPKEIVDLISRAIKMAEDFYAKNPEAFTSDHKKHYQRMIEAVNKQNYTYEGHPDLMEDNDQVDKFFPNKKPMQKAGVTQKPEQEKRGAG